MSNIVPFEDWFVFRREAAVSFLKEVLKEVRWVVGTEDPFFRNLGLAHRNKHVREVDPASTDLPIYCDCGCRNFFPRCVKKLRRARRYAFRLEMDRGRPGMGHEYVLEVGNTVTLSRMDAFNRKEDLGVPLPDLTPDEVLDGVLRFVVGEVLGG